MLNIYIVPLQENCSEVLIFTNECDEIVNGSNSELSSIVYTGQGVHQICCNLVWWNISPGIDFLLRKVAVIASGLEKTSWILQLTQIFWKTQVIPGLIYFFGHVQLYLQRKDYMITDWVLQALGWGNKNDVSSFSSSRLQSFITILVQSLD